MCRGRKKKEGCLSGTSPSRDEKLHRDQDRLWRVLLSIDIKQVTIGRMIEFAKKSRTPFAVLGLGHWDSSQFNSSEVSTRLQ